MQVSKEWTKSQEAADGNKQGRKALCEDCMDKISGVGCALFGNILYFMVMAIFINLFNGKMVAVYWFCLLNRRGCKLELNLGAYP